jgi:hypothetical protein
MTKVALFREGTDPESLTYRAVAGGSQSMGRTAGEALDALTTRLPEDEADTIIIVRNLRPDRFFGADERQRLEHLMARWRSARDGNDALGPDEQAELSRLVEAEISASARRAASLRHELTP